MQTNHVSLAASTVILLALTVLLAACGGGSRGTAAPGGNGRHRLGAHPGGHTGRCTPPHPHRPPRRCPA